MGSFGRHENTPAFHLDNQYARRVFHRSCSRKLIANAAKLTVTIEALNVIVTQGRLNVQGCSISHWWRGKRVQIFLSWDRDSAVSTERERKRKRKRKSERERERKTKEHVQLQSRNTNSCCKPSGRDVRSPLVADREATELVGVTCEKPGVVEKAILTNRAFIEGGSASQSLLKNIPEQSGRFGSKPKKHWSCDRSALSVSWSDGAYILAKTTISN